MFTRRGYTNNGQGQPRPSGRELPPQKCGVEHGDRRRRQRPKDDDGLDVRDLERLHVRQ